MFDRNKELKALAESCLISVESLSVILGSLLGDMCIAKHKACLDYFLCMRHSVIQREYFEWKVSKIKPFLGGSMRVQKPDGFSSNQKLYYGSRSSRSVTLISELILRSRKKVTRHWLNLLNDLALCIWYCDDGSLIRRHDQIILCTDAFNDEEIGLIQGYFKYLGFNTSIHTNKRVYKDKERVYKRVCVAPTRDFLLRIAPYMPCESMAYKFVIGHSNIDLAQRWTTELSNLSGFSENVFINILMEREMRRKNYQ